MYRGVSLALPLWKDGKEEGEREARGDVGWGSGRTTVMAVEEGGGRGLLTKATNHGGLDKSCHLLTISQSGNDSAASTQR